MRSEEKFAREKRMIASEKSGVLPGFPPTLSAYREGTWCAKWEMFLNALIVCLLQA
jgi:hypothetical protein